jgi:hypothetical protein
MHILSKYQSAHSELEALLFGSQAGSLPAMTKAILDHAQTAPGAKPVAPPAADLVEYDQGLQEALALAYTVHAGAQVVGIPPDDPRMQSVLAVECWLRMFIAVRRDGAAFHWPMMRESLAVGRAALEEAMAYLYQRAEEDDARAAEDTARMGKAVRHAD